MTSPSSTTSPGETATSCTRPLTVLRTVIGLRGTRRPTVSTVASREPRSTTAVRGSGRVASRKAATTTATRSTPAATRMSRRTGRLLIAQHLYRSNTRGQQPGRGAHRRRGDERDEDRGGDGGRTQVKLQSKELASGEVHQVASQRVANREAHRAADGRQPQRLRHHQTHEMAPGGADRPEDAVLAAPLGQVDQQGV